MLDDALHRLCCSALHLAHPVLPRLLAYECRKLRRERPAPDLVDRNFKADAKREVFRYIEGWYNPHRLHSGLDYLSPVNYEKTSQMHEVA